MGKTIRHHPHQALAEVFGAPKPGNKHAKGDFRGIKLSARSTVPVVIQKPY